MSVMDEWSKDPREERAPKIGDAPTASMYFEKQIKEIAAELDLSHATVKTYLERAYKKIQKKHPDLKDWL